MSGTVKTALCRPSYWVNRNEYHGFGVTQTMSMKYEVRRAKRGPLYGMCVKI